MLDQALQGPHSSSVFRGTGVQHKAGRLVKAKRPSAGVHHTDSLQHERVMVPRRNVLEELARRLVEAPALNLRSPFSPVVRHFRNVELRARWKVKDGGRQPCQGRRSGCPESPRRGPQRPPFRRPRSWGPPRSSRRRPARSRSRWMPNALEQQDQSEPSEAQSPPEGPRRCHCSGRPRRYP